ncbi:MAG: type II toxin-antitoxin system RelE/ParE family toxin [Pseudomonadota bacterium]
MLRVAITSRAAAHIERAAKWWAENRLAAQDAIHIDLRDSLSLLAEQPGIGALARSSRYPGLRRLYLSRVKYHVYYRVDGEHLVVLAFWHASRGTGPLL